MTTQNDFDAAVASAVNTILTVLDDFRGSLPIVFRAGVVATTYNVRYERSISNGVDEYTAHISATGGAVVETVTGASLQSALTTVTGYMLAQSGGAAIPTVATFYAAGTVANAQASASAGNGAQDLIEFLLEDGYFSDNIAADLSASNSINAKTFIGEDGQPVEYKIYAGNAQESLERLDATTASPDLAVAENDSFSVVAENVGVTIEGKVYVATEVLDSVGYAAKSVAGFVAQQTGEYWDNLLSQNNLSTSFNQFFAQHFEDLISGDLSIDQAFLQFGLNIAEGALSLTVRDALMSDALRDAVQASEQNGTPLDLSGVSTDELDDFLVGVFDEVGVPNPVEFAAATYEAFAQLAADFAFNSDGWSSEDYAQAGLSVITGIAINHLAEDAFGAIFGEAGTAFANTPGVIAGLTSTAVGLLNGAEIEDILVGNALSFGSTYAATQLVTHISGFSVVGEQTLTQFLTAEIAAATGLSSTGTAVGLLANAVVPVVGTVIGFIGGKIIGSLFGGKKFYPGESDNPNTLLNTLYQVQEIDDGAGGTVSALVAVDQNGATIEVISQGTNTLLGNVGQDVLIGNANENVIVGGAGSDYIEGREGDDELIGETGADHISGGSGHDYISGGADDDILFGDAGNDTVLGDSGEEFIHLGSGDDIGLGGEGDDIIIGASGDDTIDAGAGHDIIDAGTGNDAIDAGDGNDRVFASLGNDVLALGAGNDIALAEAGNDSVNGEAGDDIITGGEGVDILHGDNGNDIVSGDAGEDIVTGGLGNDTLLGGDGNDSLLGGLDHDLLLGGAGDDSLTGEAGDDSLVGGIGSDTLAGGDGDDVYFIGDDALDVENFISDNAGTSDVLVFSWLNEADVSNLTFTRVDDDLEIAYNGNRLVTAVDHFNGKTIETLEIFGGKTLQLGALSGPAGILAAPTVNAASGSIYQASLDLALDGLSSTITLAEQSFDNQLISSVSDASYTELLQEAYAQEQFNSEQITSFSRARGKCGGHFTVYKLQKVGTLTGTDGETVQQFIELDAGYDAASYDEVLTLIDKVSNSYVGTYSNGLSTVDANIEIVDYIENGEVVGSVATYLDQSTGSAFEVRQVSQEEASSISGGTDVAARQASGASAVVDIGLTAIRSGVDKLVGAWWQELISGGSGDDVIVGNGGDDILDGGAGADWIFGGDGNDVAYGRGGEDVIFGGNDDDVLYGDGDADAIIGGEGNDSVLGLAGDDYLAGKDGNDTLYGGDGNDNISGGAGNDYLVGGNGNDYIEGNEGDDYLETAHGSDTLVGGAGNDVFLISDTPGANNVIADFSVVNDADRVDISLWNVASFDDLIISQQGNSAVITTNNGNHVELVGVNAGSLSHHHFNGLLTQQDATVFRGGEYRNSFNDVSPATLGGSFTVTDVNQDGYADIVKDLGTQGLYLDIQGGDYIAVTNDAVAAYQLADVTGDGVLDIVYDRGFSGAGGFGYFDSATFTHHEFANNISPAEFGDDFFLADFNGDGKMDVLTDFGEYGLRLDIQDGAYLAPTTSNTVAYRIADITGDGVLDIVYDNGFSGAGGFGYYDVANQTNHEFQSNASPAAFGDDFLIEDFNGDGKLDVLLDYGQYGLRLNIEGGDYLAPTLSNTVAYQVADITGDGILDIVYDNGFNGTGGFGYYDVANQTNHEFQSNVSPATFNDDFLIEDFNGDGKLDVLLDYGFYGLRLDIQDGEYLAPTLGNTVSYQASDITGDGVLDIVYDNGFSGTGGFGYFDVVNQTHHEFQSNISPNELSGDYHIADFNGDGKIDVLLDYGVHGLRLDIQDGDYLVVTDSNTLSYEVKDINNDGLLDVIYDMGESGGLGTYSYIEGENDVLVGTSGVDAIYGYDGDDVLNGSVGDDLLVGGAGADTLTGGVGSDIFFFNTVNESINASSDFITDFMSGEDVINFSQLGFTGITQGVGGNGLLELHHANGVTSVIDPNSDFAIRLEGVITLTNNDFIW